MTSGIDQQEQIKAQLTQKNLLTSTTFEQPNHNPLIDEHIGDTLYNIESALRFIQQSLLKNEANKILSLSEQQAHGLFMIHGCIASAVAFEHYRAIILSNNTKN